MDETYEVDGWRTNRQKRLKPKTGRFYCDCDLNLVGAWERCEVCKKRTGKKRFKKE